jgi:protein tyrosine phosphatase (PTP) superfamily phosphohydrolase (DUF442 family)
MTDAADQDHDDSGAGDGCDYDPFEYVPDRIDGITASGLEQMYDALAERNKAKLRSVEVETQAMILWGLVEKGTISLDVTRPSQGGEGE